MIDFNLDPEHSILHIRPVTELSEEDFVDLAQVVDPHIEAHGKLAGLIIELKKFPGWDRFGSMMAHFRFVRDHHKLIRKIALVTDSPLADFAEHVTSHFVAAEIRHFPEGQLAEAKIWIAGNDGQNA